ncbi:MAG TPA: cupredoxin domain-containing protein [Patescibacteria group bacterium]|nr:cupredoxin domain-containing protein [Patescibacteria group bacterium]
MDNQPKPTISTPPTSSKPTSPNAEKSKPVFLKKILLVSVVLVITGILVLMIFVVVDHYKHNKVTGFGSLVPIEASITPTGFTPTTISINKGQAVEWSNYDTKPHSIAANPYPADNSLAGFKSLLLNQNQTYSFVFDKPGTYNYHDDLNPFTFKGTIIVK